MLALALDMGGSYIGCGVVAHDRILAQTSVDATHGCSLADLLPILTKALHGLMHEAGVTAQQCAGIAVGFPGVVDTRTGAIYSTLKKYDDAPSLDLSALGARILRPSHSALRTTPAWPLLGEQFSGVARGIEDVVMMTLGTGIGSATLLRGRLLRGSHAHGPVASADTSPQSSTAAFVIVATSVAPKPKPRAGRCPWSHETGRALPTARWPLCPPLASANCSTSPPWATPWPAQSGIDACVSGPPMPSH